MKKELARIKANDGEVEFKIRIESRCNGSLSRNELESITRGLARKIAESDLPALRYTDFGAENIKVLA